MVELLWREKAELVISKEKHPKNDSQEGVVPKGELMNKVWGLPK